MNRAFTQPMALGLSLLGIGFIAVVDWWAGERFGFSIFYAVPILYATRQLGRRLGLSIAAIAAASWLLAKWHGSNAAEDPTAQFWAGSVRFGFFILLVYYQSFLDQAREHARTDVLTRLLNRRGFVDRLAVEIERSRRNGRPITLAYLDCDHFKQVNDRWGHRQGNAVLARVGHVLLTRLRKVDVGGRLGGDEFSVIMPDTEVLQARIALDRLRQELNKAMQVGGWPVTFSIGALTFETVPESPESGLHAADALMYEVKSSGRNSIRVEVVS